MTLHHDKHHQAYVTNLNTALAKYAAIFDAAVAGTSATAATSATGNGLDSATEAATGQLRDQLALLPLLRFHGGGHINHAFFWPSLAPADSRDARDRLGVAPQLLAAIDANFGDYDSFVAVFTEALLSIQGSGWGWLVKSSQSSKPESASLHITTTKDQDPIMGNNDGSDHTPILGIDMWEHAYYLQYKNRKQSYVDNIWHIINWTTAETRYTGKANKVDADFDFIKVVIST